MMAPHELALAVVLELVPAVGLPTQLPPRSSPLPRERSGSDRWARTPARGNASQAAGQPSRFLRPFRELRWNASSSGPGWFWSGGGGQGTNAVAFGAS
jgi:hypothetical protein